MRFLYFVVILLVGFSIPAHSFPVEIENCGIKQTYTAPPQRAVAHDKNISEIMFALGLRERMVGLSGITGWYKMTPDFEALMGDLPELAPKYPSLENLLAVDPDFFFAGWYYGMRPGGEVTPDVLQTFDINTYVLTESCAHTGQQIPATMDTLYTDVRNIGRIFGRAELAQSLIDSWRARIDAITDRTNDATPRRVFVYDSGEDKPFTAGKYAMPHALIEAAGGEHVTGDVDMSWGTVSWESVITQDPELIILVDYSETGWAERWAYISAMPGMQHVAAIRNQRYLVLDYTEITPGPRNIVAVEKLAQALYGPL
ncbi:MAG: ABC transporter substrate-binding protein [Pseudomonadota bacterium]